MKLSAAEIYYDKEEYENNLAIETLNRMYYDKNKYKEKDDYEIDF